MTHRSPHAASAPPRRARRGGCARRRLAGRAGRRGAARSSSRMATLVPDGSSWHLVLKETAEKWKTVSGGRVTRAPLSRAASPATTRTWCARCASARSNAGVLTSVGVAEIDKSVYALGVPLMYDSYDEVYCGPREDAARLEASLEAKGFVVLNWADGGWVHFFTQKPVAAPDDLASSSSSRGRATRRRSRSGGRPASTRCRCPRPRSRPRSRPASSTRSARRPRWR